MSKFPRNTPKAVLKAAHREKMQGKFFRNQERGVTPADRKFIQSGKVKF